MEDGMSGNGSPESQLDVSGSRMNFIQRILGIIVSPAETTKNLVDKPRVLFPILLYILAPVIIVTAGWSHIESMLRFGFDTALSQQNMNITPDMVDQMIAVYRVVLPIIIPLILLVLWVVGTSMYFGIIKLFKGEGGFKQYLSICGYSSIITLLGMLLSFGITEMSGATVDLSLGVFMPDPSGSFALGFLKSLMGAFGVFAIWNLFVIAIGFINVSKLGKGRIYAIVFGFYGFLSILLALLAGLGTATM